MWADALCLNQKDDHEKAQQVPRMMKIYQRARAVPIWIGREDDSSREIMLMLKSMTCDDYIQEHKPLSDRLIPLLEDENRLLMPNFFRNEYLAACSMAVIAAQLDVTPEEMSRYPRERLLQILHRGSDQLQASYDAFFGRAYWRRMWIIQEVAVARKARVFCGDSHIDWEDLSLLILVLGDGKYGCNSLSDIGSSNVKVIQQLIDQVRNRTPIGLLTALQRSYGFEAGRAQDCIYALHGLAWDSDHYIHHDTVSYSKEFTINRIMFEMTRHWVERGCLDIICLQPAVGNDNSLPSWLPKWLHAGRSSSTDRLVDFLERRTPLALLSEYGRFHATAGSRSSQYQFLDQNRILLVRGAHVDTIDGLSRACESDADDPSLRRVWDSRYQAPESVQRMKEIRSHLYHTIMMHKPQIASGITDQTLNLDVLWSEDMESLCKEEELTTMLEWLNDLLTFHIYGRQLQQWLLTRNVRKDYRNRAKLMVWNQLVTESQDKVYKDDHNEGVAGAFCKVFRDGRRLMTTRRGRVGWAHPSARPGDRIYLLEGCNLPVILAPCNEPFEQYLTCILIGDAYVYGIMNGELWEQASQKLDDLFLR